MNAMEESKQKTCCFIGHRKINETDELKEKIYNTVEDLIVNKGVTSFLFGSRSDFDSLCKKIVTEFQEKYLDIKRTYIRAEYEYISDSYKDYLLEKCDDTYFPEKVSGAGRASYVERNQIMINQSDYCVFYYDENYLPPRRRNSRRDLLDYQPKSGTKIAYDYAIKKKRKIINLV
ncbi:MAG: DUF1273 family protein [Ruminococcaceae bacterium]|nr:DUF1273 family protein [Oscillospiraceae bacterium]